MTLGRFLVLFVLGLVIAWAVPQLTWLYWILAIALIPWNFPVMKHFSLKSIQEKV